MNRSPPGGKALGALSLHPLRYNLKSTLRQEVFYKESVNIRNIDRGWGGLECPYAGTNDFRGGATSWSPSIGDSLLRENWTPYRLAIIQRARQLGFTLSEIRYLFFGFRDITRPSERWRTLSERKLAELDDLMDGIKAVRGVLRKLMTKCQCNTLDQCGKSIFQNITQPVHRKGREGRKRKTNTLTTA